MIFNRRENGEPVFDGELLGRRLHAFLSRVNHALVTASDAVKDFDLHHVEVSLEVDAGLNVGFAGVGGNVGRARTFTFKLRPRNGLASHVAE